jgi:hypothetical protein
MMRLFLYWIYKYLSNVSSALDEMKLNNFINIISVNYINFYLYNLLLYIIIIF